MEAETSSALERIMGKVSENKKKTDKEKGVNQGYVKDKKKKISVTAGGIKKAFAKQTRILRYIPERGKQGTFLQKREK